MPYSHIMKAANAYGSIQYVLSKKGHNGREHRNELVSYVNLDPNLDVTYQMNRTWHRKNDKTKNLIWTVIQSFSRNELDPDNAADVVTAHEIGREFAERFGDGRQCIVATQTDGKAGLIHNHIIINAVHPETYKVFDGQRTYYKRDKEGKEIWVQNEKGDWNRIFDHKTKSPTTFQAVADLTDEICAQYFELDFGGHDGVRKSYTEDKLRKENEKIEAHNEQVHKYNQYHAEPRPYQPKKYIWKDDLRDRIERTARMSDNWDQFVENLPANGVSLSEPKSKKYVTYTLTDTYDYKISAYNTAMAGGGLSVEQMSALSPDDFEPKHRLTARSRSLGTKYSREGVLQMVDDYQKSITEQSIAKEAADAKRQQKLIQQIMQENAAASEAEARAAAEKKLEEEKKGQAEKRKERAKEAWLVHADEKPEALKAEQAVSGKKVAEPEKTEEPVQTGKPVARVPKQNKPVNNAKHEDDDDIDDLTGLTPVYGIGEYNDPERAEMNLRLSEKAHQQAKLDAGRDEIYQSSHPKKEHESPFEMFRRLSDKRKQKQKNEDQLGE